MAKRKSPLDEDLVALPTQRRSARLQISADATATTTTETKTRHGNKPEHLTKNTSAKKEVANKVNIAHNIVDTYWASTL
jgi:hypothetical protein